MREVIVRDFIPLLQEARDFLRQKEKKIYEMKLILC